MFKMADNGEKSFVKQLSWDFKQPGIKDNNQGNILIVLDILWVRKEIAIQEATC